MGCFSGRSGEVKITPNPSAYQDILDNFVLAKLAKSSVFVLKMFLK